MSKVTSKLQVSLPKALAEQFKIAPGDEIESVACGEFLKVLPSGRTAPAATTQRRLKLFDQATAAAIAIKVLSRPSGLSLRWAVSGKWNRPRHHPFKDG